MTVKDTSLPKPLAKYFVSGKTVIEYFFPKTEGVECIEFVECGTITSLSDKVFSSQLSGSGYLFDKATYRVVRWVMDHAGAGGESVRYGLEHYKDCALL